MRRTSLVALAAAVAFALPASQSAAATGPLSLSPLGTYATGIPFDGNFGAAEIPAYDAATRRVFVVNAKEEQVDVLDISAPAAPTKLGAIEFELRPNSVSVQNGLLAVALESDPKTDPGEVAFFSASCDLSDCAALSHADVGALPDMVTFSPSGRYLLVANEGEASDTIDPQGTVSVIDLRNGVADPIVDTVDFTDLDGEPVPPGAVLAAGKQPSVDFEPEYITVSKNSKRAWVALQDANAMAEIDVANASLVAVRGLGFKDHGAAGNSLDASDRDNSINMCAYGHLRGMYQPDSIASYQVANRYYIVSANEGDSRTPDEARVAALSSGSFDSTFSSTLRNNRNLGRLTINRALGLDDGIYRDLYVYGARSFSIWDESGEQVFDSGNQLERIVGSFPAAPLAPLVLNGPAVPAAKTFKCPISTTETLPTSPAAATPANSNHEEGPSFDNRSDNKGPEPEAATLGRLRGHTYAFIGLERAGGIAVYDVSDPEDPSFVQYVNPRNFAATYALPGTPGNWQTAGDLGPEGIVFIPGEDSPTGGPLLVVANEVSGTTTVYGITIG